MGIHSGVLGRTDLPSLSPSPLSHSLSVSSLTLTGHPEWTRGPGHTEPPPMAPAGTSTHKQAASLEGNWVQRPPLAHGLPSRQGWAAVGTQEGGRDSDGHPGGRRQERSRSPLSVPLTHTPQQLQGLGASLRELGARPRFPRPRLAQLLSCSCPCQPKAWELMAGVDGVCVWGGDTLSPDVRAQRCCLRGTEAGSEGACGGGMPMAVCQAWGRSGRP